MADPQLVPPARTAAQTGDTTATTQPADTTTSTTSFSSGAIPAAGGQSAAPGASPSDRAFGGGPQIDATTQAMGQHMVQGMDRANVVPGSGGQYDVHHGIHYWYNYKNECDQAGQSALWQDKYRSGHTEAKQFVQPWESNSFMNWQLKKGNSAAKAVQDWIAGATVAECLSTVIALEIDTLRASIGDKKFDTMFGSADAKEDAAVPANQRMQISTNMSATPVGNYMKATALAQTVTAQGGQFGKATPAQLDKELVPGQWYYFYNHPKYLLKHPGGAWQGENSLYMGKNPAGERTWAGLGASGMTEDAMVDEMVRAYNGPRDDYDNQVLKQRGKETADGKFTDKLYDPASGAFPDTVTKSDILTSQAFAIDATTRSGGFLASAGSELDEKRVQKTRDTK